MLVLFIRRRLSSIFGSWSIVEAIIEMFLFSIWRGFSALMKNEACLGVVVVSVVVLIFSCIIIWGGFSKAQKCMAW